MSDQACRDYYSEERLIIDFLKTIWGEGFLEYGISDANDEKIHHMHRLFTRMENEGARNEITKTKRELYKMRDCLRKTCLRIPVAELLTDSEEEIRKIGLEFQEMIENVRQHSPELVEGTTTALEVYTKCEKHKKTHSLTGTL